MIYQFSYRCGEVEAEVEANSVREAFELLQANDPNLAYTINLDLFHPELWELEDVIGEVS